MSNGNGTLDSNPLWTWIRPISVILFGVMAIILIGTAGFVALRDGNWTIVSIVAGIGLAFLGVAFGLRTLDKMLETGINLTPMNNINIGNKAELPKANGGQATVATPFFEPLDVVSAVGETPIPEPQYEPFDVGAFHNDVLTTVGPNYTEENPATIFYEARDKGSVTNCQHISQAVDYWSYLVNLARDGKDWAEEESAKKTKCDTCGAGCKGRTPEYYIFMQDFNSTIRAANALAELAITGVDLKAKLSPSNCTLYKVGILAEQMLEYGTP